VDRICAEFAQQPGFFLIGRRVPTEFIFGSVATLANGEWLAFFDSHDRDKEYVQVMVDACFVGLLKPTDRTSPGKFFNYFRFGGYAGNQKHTFYFTP
jgi:hypothetical protein